MRKSTLLTLWGVIFFSLSAFCKMEPAYAKILRPAAVTFPSRITKLILADRTCSRCLFGTNGKRLYSGPDTSIYSTLGALKTQLISTGSYTVKMAAIDTALLATEKEQLLPPLSREAAAKITGNDPTALLIVLEKKVLTYLQNNRMESYVWRVYDPESKMVLDEYEQKYDTFDQMYEQLDRKKRREELESGVIYSEAIYRYACHLLPHWEWITRKYYTEGSKKMREAAGYVQQNEWAKAAELWIIVANDSANYSARFEACYNLAVHYEFAGDFDKALEWIARAEKFGDREAASYAPHLRRRKAEAPMTNAQYANKQGQIPAPER